MVIDIGRARTERKLLEFHSNSQKQRPSLLERAIEWQRQLDAGEIETQAALARREGLTRARVTQVMNHLRRAR
ncbi:MAG TPA: hypothetical protein VK550_34380 [Polyangiaceae bacterium]|nr:hypothetical protein [Polyangiaceae bacterium]